MWTLWLAAGLALAADDDRERAHQALLPRHQEQSCAALVASLSTPGPTLVVLAESDPQPSWVAVRAAGCLAEVRPEPSREALLRWVEDAEWAGLARAAVAHLDRMPAPLARELATAAVHGPHAAVLLDRVAASESADLQAIAAEVRRSPRVGKKSPGERLRE